MNKYKIYIYIANRIEFDSIWWKHTNLVPIGKPRVAFCQRFFADRNNTDLPSRRCSYHRRLELSTVFSVALPLCRGTCLIELVAKLGLRPSLIVLRRHSRGTLWYDLLQSSSRERSCYPGRHSLRSTIYRLSRWWFCR